MVTDDPDHDVPRYEREQTVRLGGLHWLIVLLSLCLTLGAWHVLRDSLHKRAAQRFDRLADNSVELLRERLQIYADFLQTTAGFVAASEDVLPAEWQRFTDAVEVGRRFPSITGLAVIDEVSEQMLPSFLARQRLHQPDFASLPTATDRDVYYPSVLVWPDALARRVTGIDLGREERRREAIEGALASGATRMSGPLLLSERERLGFLMFASFEREPIAGNPLRMEGRATRGAVVGRVLFDDLMAGTLSRERRHLLFRLSDGDETFYDERDGGTASDADPDPLFERSQHMRLFGRQWRIETVSTLAFRNAMTSFAPTLLLAAGLLIEALLLSLFVLHTRSRRRSLAAAERLSEANADLEAFACIVSHDLKAPLQNIGHLADFIAEELELEGAGTGSPDAPRAAIGEDVERIRREVRRANRLIGGILEYTGLGEHPERPVPVDVRALLEGVRETLGSRADRLVLVGDFPTVLTYETRLEQVLANLVGNAFKYHHDADEAHVSVTLERDGERLLFAVADDGPGIEERFHEGIFEMFHTFGPGGAADSTGVGLAIVKKTVELMGGTISIDSAPGRGTTFTFDWPLHLSDEGREAAPDHEETTPARWLRAA